ncbi:MAG: hypothetical protein J0L92_25025 [Deltaproteobacteria bacterium]|nr:hypothetical protein [Deltaproteobacteria bacterium]
MKHTHPSEQPCSVAEQCSGVVVVGDTPKAVYVPDAGVPIHRDSAVDLLRRDSPTKRRGQVSLDDLARGAGAEEGILLSGVDLPRIVERPELSRAPRDGAKALSQVVGYRLPQPSDRGVADFEAAVFRCDRVDHRALGAGRFAQRGRQPAEEGRIIEVDAVQASTDAGERVSGAGVHECQRA